MKRDELVAKVPEAGWRHAVPMWDRSALLVIDMQEYFRGIASCIISDVARVIEACRLGSVPVIYTQHGHENPRVDGGMLAQWWGDLIMKGSPEWSFIREVAPVPGDKIVQKRRYSAFFDTDLQEYLGRLQVEEVIIAGVMTNLCCETTARDAFIRDSRVFVLADGTASNDEEYHYASLRNLAVGFAYLLTCDEVIRGLKGYEAR